MLIDTHRYSLILMLIEIVVKKGSRQFGGGGFVGQQQCSRPDSGGQHSPDQLDRGGSDDVLKLLIQVSSTVQISFMERVQMMCYTSMI